MNTMTAERMRRLSTYRRLEKFADTPEHINQRLKELKHKWHIERAEHLIFAVVSLIGIMLAWFVHRNWLILSVLFSAGIFFEALSNRSLIKVFLKRFGLRSLQDIEEERHALKALRGDYNHVESPAEALEDSIRD